MEPGTYYNVDPIIKNSNLSIVVFEWWLRERKRSLFLRNMIDCMRNLSMKSIQSFKWSVVENSPFLVMNLVKIPTKIYHRVLRCKINVKKVNISIKLWTVLSLFIWVYFSLKLIKSVSFPPNISTTTVSPHNFDLLIHFYL